MPCKLLGLGVLTMEMRSEKREAQPIFCCVDGDEFSAWVWFSALREAKGKRRNNLKEEQLYNIFSLLNKKNVYLVKVSTFFFFFFFLNFKHTHILNTYFCFLTHKHVI